MFVPSCLRSTLYLCVCLFQWCQYQWTKGAVRALRRRLTLTQTPPRTKRCPPHPPLLHSILLHRPPLPSACLAFSPPPSPPPLRVLVVWSLRAPAALTAQTWCVVLPTPPLYWALAASAVELLLQTATRREVCVICWRFIRNISFCIKFVNL